MLNSRNLALLAALLAVAAISILPLTGDRGAGARPDGAEKGQPASRALTGKAKSAAQLHARVQDQLDVGAGNGAMQGALRATVAPTYDRGVTIDAGSASLRVVPIGGRAAKAASEGRRSVFVDAMAGIDVVYERGTGALKESLVVHRPGARTIRYRIAGTATPMLRPDGSLAFRSGSTTLALRSPAPIAVDSAGVRLPARVARYRLDGRILTLGIDLPASARYPVVVDPTFDMGQQADHSLMRRDFTDTARYMGRDPSAFNDAVAVGAGGGTLLTTDYWGKVGVWNGGPVGNGASRSSNWGSAIWPHGVWTDGTKALVSDQVGSRLYVHNSMSATPSFIVGQPDFGGTQRNEGGLSQSSLSNPQRVWSDGTRIVLADTGNNRILIYSSWPTAHKPNADIVLGQGNFTSRSCNRGGPPAADTICGAIGVWSDGTRLYVADTNNHRILGWDTFPTTSGEPADFVLGQAGFATNGCNGGGTDKLNLCSPLGVSGTTGAPGSLLVVDGGKQRVLGWSSLPTTTGDAADVIIGVTNSAGTTQNQFSGPTDVTMHGAKVVISDRSNNRVMIWNTLPGADSAPADQVLGHPDFVTGGKMDNRGEYGLDPQGLDLGPSGLWVTSAHDAKTLRFPSGLPLHGGIASYAIGAASPGEMTGWSHDRGHPCWANQRLVETDSGVTLHASGQRVSWWLTPPATNPPPVIDGAVGAGSAGHCGWGGAAQTSIAAALDADYDGRYLVVADANNNRVMIWDGLPTAYGEPADVVLGQSDFTSSDPNAGGVSASTLWGPRDVQISDGKLFVADNGNHRVLIWNTMPTTNAAPADVVVGQAGMQSGNAAQAADRLYQPHALDVEDGMLVVADRANHRVAIWDTIPTTNGVAADRAIGQPNLTSYGCAVSRTQLCSPFGVSLRDGRLAVLDHGSRVLIFNDVQGPGLQGVAHVVAGARATVSWSTDEDASSELLWDTVSHPTEAGYANTAANPGLRRTHSVAALPLVAGTTYYYRVRSVDSRGNVTVGAEQMIVAQNRTRFQAAPAFTDDATIDSRAPGDNFGATQTLVVGDDGTGAARAAVRFDLSQIPAGATITGASLQLTATDVGAGGNPQIEAVRLAGSSFEEGLGTGSAEPEGVTWTSPNGIDPWVSAGGDTDGAASTPAPAPAAAGLTTTLDVTAQVSAWAAGAPNEGLLLRAVTEPGTTRTTFASSQHADHASRPVLVVDWEGSDATNPTVAGIQVQQLDATSVRLTWDTDEQTSSRVEFGTTAAYGSLRTEAASANRHDIVLAGLTPNTGYHVRVGGSDAQGNQHLSSDREFRTSYRVELLADDAFVRANMTDRNFGGQPSAFVGNAATGWQTARSMYDFDVESLPPGAIVRNAKLRLVLANQADGTQPPLSVHRLNAPFAQGTGNPLVGPTVVGTSADVHSGPDPLHVPSEPHVVRTPSSWWQIVPRPDVWYSTFMYGRRSYDGTAFGADSLATPHTGWGKEGISMQPDGSSLWVAGMVDGGGSTMNVVRLDAETGATLSLNQVSWPAGATAAPGIARSDDGHLWIKVEDQATGAVYSRRATAAGSAATWGASTLVSTMTTPAHAQLVPLDAGRMLVVSQDGTDLRSQEWTGSAWSAPQVLATGLAAPLTWREHVSHASVSIAGDVWTTFVAAGEARVVHHDGTTWTTPSTIAASASSVAISGDTNTGRPYAFWQDGTALRYSGFDGATWGAPTTVPATLPSATPTQVSVSTPSDESLAVTWTQRNSATHRAVRWFGITLPKSADGVTWDQRVPGQAWTVAGGDAEPAAIDTKPAPNVLGNTVEFDLTSQVERWHAGTDMPHGVVVRKATENTAVTDWKSFTAREGANAQLRPRLVVDYDIASVVLSEPNASTAWRTSSTREVAWQVSGSGMTTVDLYDSRDGGSTWTPIVAGAPNTGAYNWSTPPSAGPIRVRIDARNALGDVVATDSSATFVLDDTPPDPVDDLVGPSPTGAPALSWTAPADTGGAGMANGSYRVYRSGTVGQLGSRVATVSSLAYTDVAALVDGQYQYTVLPVDAAGNVMATGNSTLVVDVDRSAPNAVTTLAAPALTRSAVLLSWTAPTDVGLAGMGTYRLYRSTTAGPLGSLVQTVGATSTSDTPPADGTYHYTVAPIDNAGNARLTGNTQVAVAYDTTPPAGVAISLDGGAATSADLDLTATLTGGDATDVQLSEDPTFAGAPWQAVTATAPFTLAATDGTRTVYARFRDAAGNVSSSTNDTIVVDTTPPAPVTTLTAPSPAQSAVLTWSAASDGSGTGTVLYRVYRSATAGTLGAQLSTTTSLTFTDVSGPDGTWHYTVQAQDALGNLRTTGNTQHSVTIDTTAPGIVASGATEPWHATNANTYDVDVTDTVALSHADLQIWSGAGATGSLEQDWTLARTLSGTSDTTDWTLPASVWDALADGTHYVSVRVVDAAGNVTSHTDAFVLRTDTTDPSAVLNTAAPALTNVAPTVSWDAASDASSGIDEYRVYRSATAGVLGSRVDPGNVVATSLTDPTLPADGTWHYTVQAVDTAGNERLSGNATATVVVDTQAPTSATVELAGGAAWSRVVGLGVDLGAVDAVDMQLSEDPTFAGASWQPMAASTTWNTAAADGAVTLHVRFRDAAGNVSAGVFDAIGLDRVAPAQVTPAAASPSTSAQLGWAGAVDATSGTVAYRIYRSTAAGTLGPQQAEIVGTTWNDPSAPDGTSYYTVRAVDAAGNEQPLGTQEDVVVDSTPPAPVTDLTGASPTATVSLTWSAAVDATSGTTGYRVVRRPGGATGPFVLLTVTATRTFAEVPPADGTYEYRVEAVDAVGNVQAIGNTVTTITFDSQAPAGTSLQITGGAAWTRARTIQLTLAGGSDGSEYRVSEDATFAGGGAPWQPLTPSTSFVLGTQQGQHVVSAQYRDAARNAGGAVYASIGLDDVAPAGTTTVSAPAHARATTLSWPSASDATSGVSGYRVYAWPALGGVPTLVGETAASTWTAPAAEGAWKYAVQAIDVAGNEQAMLPADQAPTTTIDLTDPVIERIRVNASGPWSRTRSIPVVWDEIADPTAEVQLATGALTNEGWRAARLRPSVLLEDKDGMYTILARARDAAGNVSHIEKRVIGLDRTPPVVTTRLEKLDDSRRRVSWTSADAVSKVDRVQVRVVGAPGSSAAASSPGSADAGADPDEGSIVIGASATTLEVTGIDHAGNELKRTVQVAALSTGGTDGSGTSGGASGGATGGTSDGGTGGSSGPSSTTETGSGTGTSGGSSTDPGSDPTPATTPDETSPTKGGEDDEATDRTPRFELPEDLEVPGTTAASGSGSTSGRSSGSSDGAGRTDLRDHTGATPAPPVRGQSTPAAFGRALTAGLDWRIPGMPFPIWLVLVLVAALASVAVWHRWALSIFHHRGSE